MKLVRMLAEFYATPWAILPERLNAIAMVLHRAADGVKLSSEQIQAVVGDAPAVAADRRAQDATIGSSSGGAVAVLPLFGIISHRAHQVDDISGPGGTSTERFTNTFRQLVNDPGIESIVIDVDSPGGTVQGVPELADEIFAARDKKKVVAIANSMAASAAYWIGTAAGELVVTPSGEVGSVGVWTAHADASKYFEAIGVKWSLISAGKFKTEGNQYEPLGDEARAAIQEAVDAYYEQFVKAIAKHRGVKVADVRSGFGQGRTVRAKDAVDTGMADRVATMDETIARLLNGHRKSGSGKRVDAADLELKVSTTESSAAPTP